MAISGQRAFELLTRLSFTRVSGTDEELKAAQMLAAEIESIGLEATIEPFGVVETKTTKATFEVLEPFKAEYEVTAYIGAPSTPEGGLEAEFLYAEDLLPANLKDAKGKFVLINGRSSLKTFEKLVEAGVAGFMTTSGTINDEDHRTDLDTRRMRDSFAKNDLMPAVNIRMKDALEILRGGASKVRVVVENEDLPLTSHNVYATIVGTEYPDEIVTIGSHFDSVPFSTGAYDNGTGSVINMEFLRHFKENPPKRTMRFVWYGSEETGLYGSVNYTKDHEEELKDYRLMINFDMAGTILGRDVAIVTAEQSLVDYTDYLAKELGFPIEARQEIYSSDGNPFAQRGVPVINFCRFGGPGAGSIHDRYDTTFFLSAESLQRTMDFTIVFTERMVNAAMFPVPRTMPDNMVEKVKEYMTNMLPKAEDEEKKEDEKK